METLFGLFVVGLLVLLVGVFVFLVLTQVVAHWLTDPRAAEALDARLAAKQARRAAARSAGPYGPYGGPPA